MSSSSLTLAAAEDDAKAKGLVVKTPARDELFVDIDSDADFEVFAKHLKILGRFVAVRSYTVSPSNSGGERRHVVVRLSRDVVDDSERVLLQAVLGSDRLRELLSWERIRSGVREHPTVFFEKPILEEAEASPQSSRSVAPFVATYY